MEGDERKHFRRVRENFLQYSRAQESGIYLRHGKTGGLHRERRRRTQVKRGKRKGAFHCSERGGSRGPCRENNQQDFGNMADKREGPVGAKRILAPKADSRTSESTSTRGDLTCQTTRSRGRSVRQLANRTASFILL